MIQRIDGMRRIFSGMDDNRRQCRLDHILQGANMRNIIKALAAVGLVSAFSGSASAESLDVKANTVTPVGFFYFYTGLGDGCTTLGKPKIRVNNEPDHGTLKTEWRKMKMNKSGGCLGKPASGVAVWYIPNKGSRGKDKFSFTMSFPGIAPGSTYGESRYVNYNLNVQ